MISFCWRIVWNCSEEIYCTKGCLGTIMKKRVTIINDDLGTMALGFSKAGYDVSAIYVTQAADLDVDFVAGKIAFGFSVAGKQREPINENGIALKRAES